MSPSQQARPADASAGVESAHRLALLATELLAEAASRDTLQSTRPVADPVSGLRQTLIALAGVAAVETDDAGTPGSLHVLRGTARLLAGEHCTDLQTHDYVPLPIGRHVISADAATVILHSVVLPPDPCPMGCTCEDHEQAPSHAQRQGWDGEV
jgi:hypothetical protein